MGIPLECLKQQPFNIRTTINKMTKSTQEVGGPQQVFRDPGRDSGSTGLHEILGRDYGIEEHYWVTSS